MAIAHVDKVVSLTDYQRAGARGKSTTDTVGVLNDCRDLAVKRICEVVARAFDKIEDELFGLAENTVDRELQNLFLDARAQAREKRSMIEESFRKRFVVSYNGKAGGAPAPAPTAAIDYGAMTLSLVDDSALEEAIALAEMTKKLKSNCEDELFALSQRMGFLLHDPELADDANPISPETVCGALKEACDQITVGYRVKLTILKLFEQHVAKDMLAVYRDINSHLVTRHQILPQIRTTYRRTAQASALPRKNAAQEGAKVTTASAPDLFATLQQLMMQGGAQIQANTAGPAAQGMPGATLSMPASGLIHSLSQIQHSPPPGVMAAPHAGNGTNPSHAFNILHDIRSGALATTAAPLDALTMDIVAMLFDYVFAEKHLPEMIKALLARLQIPVLKVALLDRSFFSVKSHPARRLLDALAELALECDEGIDREDPLYLQIEAVVDRVQNGFETDITLFSDQVAELEAYVARREQEGIEFIEQSARLVHERERSEIARLVAASAINERLLGKTLPAPVVVMLKGRWVDVLKQAHMACGEEGDEWERACTTVEELVWSVQPKINADDRRSLVSLLPTLLKRLQAGMCIAGMEQAERAHFFSALIDCHAAAVKAGLREENNAVSGAAPPGWVDAASYLAAELDARPGQETNSVGLTHNHVDRAGVQIEEIRLQHPRPDRLHDLEGSSNGRVLPLKRGAWAEFRRADGRTVRAKLAWISPLKGIYLFTSAHVQGAISISPEALAAQMREGQARILEEAPLMQRAVDSLLDTLKEKQLH